MADPVTRLNAALAGRYSIEREIGEGGMATVYLADDLKHDRKVALKVLKPELAAVVGAERFLAEIKTTANLQHPHILPLFDSGEADGFLFFVMPYVEGESLRDRLDGGGELPVEAAVRIATAVASALDSAHRQGVIHRDIKPANILLHDGQPLVADFGIALAVSAAGGGRLTETGLSLGTPYYMSPEQATAERDPDPRSDVYALGCVLYEMLVGEPPYTGASAQAVLGKILTTDPVRPTEHRKTIPAHVEVAVLTALEKRPADRFGTAGAFAAALADPAYHAVRQVAPGISGLPSTRATVGRYVGWLAALVCAAAAMWGWLRPARSPAVARYGLALPADQQFRDSNNPGFAVSPDGSWIVFQGPAPGGVQLWIKERDRYEAVPVPGTTTQASGLAPAISPDGRWIVFWADRQLRKVPRGGGPAVTVADSVAAAWRGVAWLDDGTIVYRDEANRLRRVPEIGGIAEVVWTPPEEGRLAALPTALPGSRGVLFLDCGANCSEVRDLWVLDLRTGEATRLLPDAGPAWYIATGHVVYVRSDGNVFAAPFDLGSLSLTGDAVPVLEGVQVSAFMPDFALSGNGTVLMIVGPPGGLGGIPVQAVWVDRTGREAPVDPAWQFEVGPRRGIAISPDGARLALEVRGQDGDDIWIKELDGGPISRLTFDPAEDTRPRWTPDGRSVSFVSARGTNHDLYVRRAEGTQPPQLVLDLDTGIWESQWSRDGQWLVLRVGTFRERDIAVLRRGVDSLPGPLVASRSDEGAAALSPDGRWLAYQSNETGQNEVYVRPFPDVNAGKWTVSVGGGSQPLWAHSGTELFYVDGQELLVAARLQLGGQVVIEDQQPLFSVSGYLLSSNYAEFDVSPDDRRFLLLRRAGPDGGVPQPTMVIVENWFEELRQKLETR